MKWLHIRLEILAGIIIFMQLFSIKLLIHGSKVGFVFSISWTILIFVLVWFGLVKRVEALS